MSPILQSFGWLVHLLWIFPLVRYLLVTYWEWRKKRIKALAFVRGLNVADVFETGPILPPGLVGQFDEIVTIENGKRTQTFRLTGCCNSGVWRFKVVDFAVIKVRYPSE
jgi:hypothetical protein